MTARNQYQRFAPNAKLLPRRTQRGSWRSSCWDYFFVVEVGQSPAKQANQAGAVGWTEAMQGLFVDGDCGGSGGVTKLCLGIEQIHALQPVIALVAFAAYVPLGGHPFEQLSECRGIDVGPFAQLRLGQSVLAPKTRQHDPLRNGESMLTETACEFRRHRFGELANNETGTARQIEANLKRAFISYTNVSYTKRLYTNYQ